MRPFDQPRAVVLGDPTPFDGALGVAAYAAPDLATVVMRAQRADTLYVAIDAAGLAEADLAAAIRAMRAAAAVPIGVIGGSAAGADAAVPGPAGPAAAWTLLQRLARQPGGELRRLADARRAPLKIYLGAAPGVGKTMAMLQEAHDRRARGEDVAVALVETHGRAGTEARLAGLEVVPRRRVTYHGAALTELDLDAVLARRPALALVDELAHTNVPGSANAKRWEDVAVLRLAGIPVVTTLNVQHLEGLNHVVERLTGVKVRETVPDALLAEAAEVVLVDLPPEALQQRLQAGMIYAPDKVGPALANFFTTPNLTALRELVLRELADQVDERAAAPTGVQDRLLVCVTASDAAERLIRRGARLADRLNGALVVLHVEERPPTAAERAALARHVALAERLEAQMVRLKHPRAGEAIARYAATHPITVVLLGRSRRPAWRGLFERPLAEVVLDAAPELDVVTIAAR